MFIGHFAVGFAAKKFAPRTSMAFLLAARLFLDMLWPIFVLAGWEQVRIDPGDTRYTLLDFVHYPWSHSLLMSIVWATLLALLYHRIAGDRTGPIALWIGGRKPLGVRLDHASSRHAALSRRPAPRTWLMEFNCRHDGCRNRHARCWGVALRACDSCRGPHRKICVRRVCGLTGVAVHQ
jgi:hypothetical protein